MSRIYVRKPPEERATEKLTIPLTPLVHEALVRAASDRSITKTDLARKLIEEGLAA